MFAACFWWGLLNWHFLHESMGLAMPPSSRHVAGEHRHNGRTISAHARPTCADARPQSRLASAHPSPKPGLSPTNASRPLASHGLPYYFVPCVNGGACVNLDQPENIVPRKKRAACLETAPNTLPKICLFLRAFKIAKAPRRARGASAETKTPSFFHAPCLPAFGATLKENRLRLASQKKLQRANTQFFLFAPCGCIRKQSGR